jgi:hypothetical protein
MLEEDQQIPNQPQNQILYVNLVIQNGLNLHNIAQTLKIIYQKIFKN